MGHTAPGGPEVNETSAPPPEPSRAWTLGALNAHAVSIIMKEIVQRAMTVIRGQRFVFEATEKVSSYKAEIDLVTTADHAAQAVYLRSLLECFPGVGIVAEEGELSVPCSLEGIHAYFTVDPLDGTKAFARRQSHGVGSMLSLVVDGDIVAVCIGDVMTGELYAYRPDSDQAHRISPREHAERLAVDANRPLCAQTCLMRALPIDRGPVIDALAHRGDGPFRSIEVSGGSVGIAMARLWKGEVGAMLLDPAPSTPWDFTPLLGMCRRLGFRFLALDPGVHRGRVIDPVPSPRIEPCDHHALIIHGSRVGEFIDWQDGMLDAAR